MPRPLRACLLSLFVPALLGSVVAQDQPQWARLELVERFDADRSGHLEAAERTTARAWITANPRTDKAGVRIMRATASLATTAPGSGENITPNSVPHYREAGLYEQDVLRTVFLEFPGDDWETELTDFYRTDVEVPVTVIVDGKTYAGVGASFRGSSSFFDLDGSRKKSFNLSVDFTNGEQRLAGYRTINLLNCHGDPSFIREFMHSQIARDYIPALRANLVKLVINGESWGVYANVQQFNKDFLEEGFRSKKGVRWKVPASVPGTAAPLVYFGPDRTWYEQSFDLKTAGDVGAWDRLIALCRTLASVTDDETLIDELPSILDIDGALWFLALDSALLDPAGYQRLGSDYLMHEDKYGRFHLIPYDTNEILRSKALNGGPLGALLASPFEQIDNPARPLIKRLLAVPAWRARYLHHLRTITQEWLGGTRLARLSREHLALVGREVQLDSKRLYGHEEFIAELTDPDSPGSLAGAAARRHDVILADKSMQAPWPTIESVNHTVEPTTAGVQLTVSIEVRDDVPVSDVFLYTQLTRREGFVAVRCQSTGGGTYQAITPMIPPGEKMQYYVEARAAQHGTTAFAPATCERGALEFEAPVARRQ